jgi:Sucrase/ferredoxin-like
VTTSCSVLGEQLGEDLAATAPKNRRFLLLEQNGPWTGRNAVTHSDLDEGIARALLVRGDEAGVKVYLVRRSSRRGPLETRSVFLADTRRDGPSLRRFELGDPAEALAIDLEGGVPVEGPLYAVCTHGKRDPCCARRGRPLARALRAGRADATWEIGHIGGHRFAATFLAFPHGLCFGRVPAARGPEIAAALEAGEIVLEHFRGRAGDPPVVQAADVLVRRELGLRGIDDLAIVAAGDSTVVVETRGQRLRATIARREAAPRPISCGDEPEPVPVFELAKLVATDRAA